MNHKKCHENGKSNVIFSETLTEAITVKNLELTSNMVWRWNNLNIYGILYTVEKILKNEKGEFFGKQWLKLLPSGTWK